MLYDCSLLLHSVCRWNVSLFFFFISFCCLFFHSQDFSFKNRIVENSGTYLTKDNIHIATAQNDFCWHVATDTQNVPLEQISDVEISRPCFTSCFGLSAIRVQHPGNISVGPKGRVLIFIFIFLSLPSFFLSSIDHFFFFE